MATAIEKQVWDAACVLRNNIDASEYKVIILGLIFLKYVSDRFDERYQELLSEGYGDEEDRDFYLEKNIFFAPPEARWSQISAAAHTPEIGLVIDNAMRAIERENKKQLDGVLPKNFARPELDKRKLGDIVDLFTNIKLSKDDEEVDVLGRIYEYCLAQFAAQEGRNAGEFYTPTCVVRTLVEVLKPFSGVIYDPCCGSGGMFVQSGEFIKSHQGNINQVSVYGQDSNATTRKLAKMNLAIRGIEANLGEEHADTFTSDLHPNVKADFILANPPFNSSSWGANALVEDVRWKYGVPPDSNANYAWIQHMLFHLKNTGRLGLVLANSALTIATGPEFEIRKRLVEEGLVDCIVALPSQLFFSTKIKVSLWFMRKTSDDNSDILFIDTRSLGHMITRTMREFSHEDILRIASTVNAFLNNDGYEDVEGFCRAASLEEIESKRFSLSPTKYVKGAADASDIEDWQETMADNLEKATDLHYAGAECLDSIQGYLRDTLVDGAATMPTEKFLNSFFDIGADKSFGLIESLKRRDSLRERANVLSSKIANELFKYWFVDFNFPDSLGMPYSEAGGPMKDTVYGKIPSSWNAISMGSILSSKNEKVRGQEGIPEYSTTNNGVFPRSQKFNKALSKSSSKNKVIRYGDIVFGMSREILNFGVMKENVGAVSPAYHVYAIDDSIMNPEFLEFYMRICSDYFLSLIKPGAREGQVLDKEELERKPILCPPIEVQNSFVLLYRMLPELLIGSIGRA